MCINSQRVQLPATVSTQGTLLSVQVVFDGLSQVRLSLPAGRTEQTCLAWLAPNLLPAT